MRLILDQNRSEVKVKANGLKVFLPPLEFDMFRLVASPSLILEYNRPQFYYWSRYDIV